MQTLDMTSALASLEPASLRELSTFGALSDACVQFLLRQGRLLRLERSDVLYPAGARAGEFYVVLDGTIAFYKHSDGRDVLTRHFRRGEQLGFDGMIGLHDRSGTAVAVEPVVALEISSALFFDLHTEHPTDFGLMMINLSRELSREIALLEDVIGRSNGWSGD